MTFCENKKLQPTYVGDVVEKICTSYFHYGLCKTCARRLNK